MTSLIDTILLIVHVVSFVIALLYGFLYMADEEGKEKVLKLLHIPLTCKQADIIGIVSVIVTLVCFLLKDFINLL